MNPKITIRPEEHKEAVSALVDWALRQPGVVRIRAEAEEGNAASLRVLEKAGFAPTGERGMEGWLFECRKTPVLQDG